MLQSSRSSSSMAAWITLCKVVCPSGMSFGSADPDPASQQGADDGWPVVPNVEAGEALPHQPAIRTGRR